jgi:TonB family protein
MHASPKRKLLVKRLNREIYVRTPITFAIALLALISTAAVAQEPASTIVHISWKVSVGSDGHVTRLTTTDTLVPGIHERLEQEIRGWRFSPGKVNGEPATTDSNLQLTLDVRPVDANSSTVHVVGVSTGGGYGKTLPPHYPVASARARRQGLVLLKVRYDVAGKVVDVVRADDAPRVDEPFVRSAIDATRKWTFEPEVVGGHPLAGSMWVPVCFSLRHPGIVPQNCNWRRPGDALDTPEALALDPVVKLLTDVIGHAL